jgi:hypothetical protein
VAASPLRTTLKPVAHESNSAPRTPGWTESPRAFVSYAHEDVESAIRLVEELKLRGFDVFRDVERMREGRRLLDEMGAGIDRADLVMCLLTPSSLASTPVIEGELKPSLRKAARSGRPIVMPVVCGLGNTHDEVTTHTWAALQHDFASTWTGGILPTEFDQVGVDDAARLADKALRAVLSAGVGPGDGAWSLDVATRGCAPASDGLSVDATSFLGGAGKLVGHPAAWARLKRGITELEQALRAHGRRREIAVAGDMHLTAGVAVGYTFRRTTGWRLRVRADDQAFYPLSNDWGHSGLRVLREPGSPAASLITAEINLTGRQMDGLVDDVLSTLGRPSERLRIEHVAGSMYIPCDQLAAMAGTAANAMKEAVSDRRADTVHLFLAGPAAFAVLLGAELNALGPFLQLYEWADHAYHASLELESR